MRILIVGAGIAGLTAAALLQDEHDVTIIEKQADPGKGYAIGIWASAFEVFEKLGIKDELLARGVLNPDYAHTDHTGSVLVHAQFGEEPMIVELAHDDLRELLEQTLRVEVEYETTIEETGEEFDVIIGADGVHSQLRERMEYTKTTVGWKAAYGWSTVPAGLPAQVTEAWKPAAMIGMYSHGTSRGCTIGFFPNTESFEESFQGFKGVAKQIRQSIQEVHISDLYWVECKKPYTQNMLLIGDAAHAMPPFGGVGGTMAIEDAWVLSQELAQDVTRSFQRYVRRRKSRWKLAKKQTKQQWRWKKIRNPLLAYIRNRIATYVPVRHFMKGFEKMVLEKP